MFIFFYFVVGRYEKLFGCFSDHNLCVTNAMREDLKKNWNIEYVFNYFFK